MKMKAWQNHLHDICVAEKRNQLDRVGAASINKNFQDYCHKHRDYSKNNEAPWQVMSKGDYLNMPFVVWAKVIKHKADDKNRPSPKAGSKSPAKHQQTSLSEVFCKCAGANCDVAAGATSLHAGSGAPDPGPWCPTVSPRSEV